MTASNGLRRALVVLVIAVAVGGCAAGSRVPGAAGPAGEPAISAAGLVGDTTAWAVDSSGLHLSSDGGRSWRLRSPRVSGSLDGAGFVGRGRGGTTGWVTSFSATGDIVVHRTSSAGAAWTSTTLRPRQQAASAHVDLLDAMHGWVAVKFATSVNFSIGELYRSADGGASFTRSALPTFGDLSFVDPLVGFLSGGGPGRDQLWRTRDGGASWSRAVVDAGQASSAVQLAVSAPVMLSERNGYLPVTVTAGDSTRVLLDRTTDGGAHWIAGRTSVVVGSTGAGFAVPAAVVSASEMVAIDPADGRVLRSGDGGSSWHGQAAPALPGGVREVRFGDAGHGLALTDASYCTGFKQDCHRVQRLFLTRDGGRTWQEAEL